MAMQEQQTLRLGIVGLGGAARQMIPALVKHPHVAIAAAADVDTDALDAFVRDSGAEAYCSVEEMCANANIDAVYIATPTQLHVEHALSAIQHGKHLLLEKPLATTLEGAETIIQAAEAKELRLVVCSPHSLAPPTQAILGMLKRGELGQLRMVHSWFYSDWLYRPRTAEELNPDPELGGGVVFRQGPHQFDMLRTLCGGEVASVSATVGAWDGDRPVPGSYTVFLRFSNEVSATAVYSGYDRFHTTELTFGGGVREDNNYGKARKALQATKGDAELSRKRAGRYGGGALLPLDRGVPAFSWISDLLIVVTGDKAEVRVMPTSIIVYGEENVKEVPLPVEETGRDRLVGQFYDAVVNNVAPSHDGRWGKATLEVSLAVMQSAREGREVTLKHQVASAG
jgi:phthalate 4,5-cis-dihydrodiol dehydrogenase